MTEVAQAPVSAIGSVAELERTINLAREHGQIVVGSIGRAVVFNELTGNPYVEFEARGQDPLVGRRSGWVDGRHVWDIPSPRDVDTIGGRKVRLVMDKPLVHPLQDTAFDNQEYHLTQDREGFWHAFTTPMDGRAGIHHKFPGEMFAIHAGSTIFGIECPTVSAALHYVLLANNPTRPQDEKAQRLLLEVMPQEAIDLISTEPYRQLLDTRISW